MAVHDQIRSTYDDTAAQVRVIGNQIFMIDPFDTPLIAALGGLNAARNKFDVRLNGKKIEILEDTLPPLLDTANHGTTITTATLVITVTDGSIFQAGYVIQIDSEYMVVASVSGEEVTVKSRAYGGTNATHVAASIVYIRGMARDEGADATYGPIPVLTNPYNYTSIFQRALNVSGTEQAIEQYGMTDWLSRQSSKAVPHLMRLVEQGAFHSQRAAGSKAAAPRSMGNLKTYITDNTVGAGGAIAKSHIDALAEKVFGDGGNPDLLVMNHAVAGDLKTILDSSSFVRVGLMNTVLGMVPLQRVNTQYGQLTIIMDRWCPVADAYMLDSSKVGFYTLRPFGVHDIAKIGDSEKNEVIGEFSLLVANDKAHGRIEGITS